MGLQLLAIYLPALDQFFGVEPLSLGELLLCVGLGALSFGAIEAEKWVQRRRARCKDAPRTTGTTRG